MQICDGVSSEVSAWNIWNLKFRRTKIIVFKIFFSSALLTRLNSIFDDQWVVLTRFFRTRKTPSWQNILKEPPWLGYKAILQHPNPQQSDIFTGILEVPPTTSFQGWIDDQVLQLHRRWTRESSEIDDLNGHSQNAKQPHFLLGSSNVDGTSFSQPIADRCLRQIIRNRTGIPG